MSAKEDNEIKNYWSKLLIFIIIIAFGYLSYYKFLIYDKRDVNNNNVIKKEENNSKGKNDTKSKPSDADNSGDKVEYKGNDVVENNDNNQNNNEIQKIKTYDQINYEIKEDYCDECSENLNYLYVNGRKIEEVRGDIKVNKFKDILIVEWVGFTSYDHGVVYVTNDGNKHKFDYLTNNYGSRLPNTSLVDYKIINNAIEFKVTRDDGFDNTTGWMCKKDEVVEYTKRYQYEGNGIFDNGKIIDEVLIKDKFQNPEGCE